MKRQMKHLFCAVAVCFTFCMITTGCASKKTDMITVYGMVYDNLNNPVPDYEITINENFKTTSDFGGRFVFFDLPSGEHDIFGKKSGYSSTRQTMTLDGQKVLYLRVSCLENDYAHCFKFMENGDYEEARSLTLNILQISEEDETASVFLSVIEQLSMEEKSNEENI